MTILSIIKEDNNVTREELAKLTNLSIPTVDRNLKKLKEKGYIKRIGSDKTGSWKVLK